MINVSCMRSYMLYKCKKKIILQKDFRGIPTSASVISDDQATLAIVTPAATARVLTKAVTKVGINGVVDDLVNSGN